MPEATLTKEMQAEVDKAVCAAMDALKSKEVNRKFTPSAGMDGQVQVVKDEADQPFPSLGMFLQAVARAGSAGAPIREPRLKRCTGTIDPITKAPLGMGETVPSDGAFLVAQEFIPDLINRAYNTGIVVSKCRKQIVGPNFNGFKIPAIDETSRADGSRFGGVQAYWGAEAATITASKPKIRQISVELEKLFALCYVADEMLKDSIQLESYINLWFPQEIGFKLDDAVIEGDGAGKPLGILNSPALVTVAKETGQATGSIVTNNVLKAYRRMWGPSLAGAAWFINQDTIEQLATLTIPIGTAGALANLFQYPTGAAASAQGGGSFGTILTKPVYAIEQASTVGTVGDVIFANFDQYIMGDKGGVNQASSIHVQFVTDQVAFRWIYRCNGESMWHAPLTPFKGTSTLSPFVVIATR